MKYAWYSSEDSNQSYDDGYHKNIGSFVDAFKQSSKTLVDKWSLNPKEVQFVGAAPCGMEVGWDTKILTEKEIKAFVAKDGFCQFALRYIDKSKSNDGYIQGWASISTMEYFNKEQEELKQQYQEIAQEEADRTGKKASIQTLGGWNFEAEPKKTKKGKKTK